MKIEFKEKDNKNDLDFTKVTKENIVLDVENGCWLIVDIASEYHNGYIEGINLISLTTCKDYGFFYSIEEALIDFHGTIGIKAIIPQDRATLSVNIEV